MKKSDKLNRSIITVKKSQAKPIIDLLGIYPYTSEIDFYTEESFIPGDVRIIGEGITYKQESISNALAWGYWQAKFGNK